MRTHSHTSESWEREGRGKEGGGGRGGREGRERRRVRGKEDEGEGGESTNLRSDWVYNPMYCLVDILLYFFRTVRRGEGGGGVRGGRKEGVGGVGGRRERGEGK